jgi:hypothetical protein
VDELLDGYKIILNEIQTYKNEIWSIKDDYKSENLDGLYILEKPGRYVVGQ